MIRSLISRVKAKLWLSLETLWLVPSFALGSYCVTHSKRLTRANGALVGFCGDGMVVDGQPLTSHLPFSYVLSFPPPFAFLPNDLPHDAVGTSLLLPPLSPVLLSASPIDEWFSRGECALDFNFSLVKMIGCLPELFVPTSWPCAACDVTNVLGGM